jgi:hypothetical protein
MKATITGLAALLALAVFAPASHAQYYPPSYPRYYAPIPRAPDLCNPCNYYSPYTGANFNVYPPFQPFNGAVFPPSNGNGNGMGATQLFPTHPFARSPRDYFMVDGAACGRVAW